jgi:molybdopterin synthase sulfur carrier subunit
MVEVQFTSALKRFFPTIEAQSLSATKVSELLVLLDEKYPGIKDYLVEEDGSLRKHVNIFINNDLIDDRMSLSDTIKEKDIVLIFQALSGG